MYPKFDNEFLGNFLDQSYSCGWAVEYDKLPIKYNRTLLQTRPTATSQTRGQSLSESPPKVTRKRTKEEYMAEKKRKVQ
jgi:hypothetical protein